MGTIGRNIFLFFPFLLTGISLGLLITIMLSQHSTSMLSNLYFLRVNTKDLNVNINVQNVNINANLGQTGLVPGYYDIGLTNYCTGPDNKTSPNFCSKPTAGFYFNPLDVWNLEDSPIKNLVPNEWESALKTYKQASKWMYAAYVVALVATIITLLLGIASFFLSRITSIFTWICADIAALFTAGSSAAATAIFSILAGVVRTKLHDEGITTTFGTRIIAITWIATAASIAAALLFSCGMCCGHSKHNDTKRSRSLKGRSAYERVPSPFKHESQPLQHNEEGFGAQHNNMPMYGQPQHQWPGNSGMTRDTHTGYEPYRQV